MQKNKAYIAITLLLIFLSIIVGNSIIVNADPEEVEAPDPLPGIVNP